MEMVHLAVWLVGITRAGHFLFVKPTFRLSRCVGDSFSATAKLLPVSAFSTYPVPWLRHNKQCLRCSFWQLHHRMEIQPMWISGCHGATRSIVSLGARVAVHCQFWCAHDPCVAEQYHFGNLPSFHLASSLEYDNLMLAKCLPPRRTFLSKIFPPTNTNTSNEKLSQVRPSTPASRPRAGHFMSQLRGNLRES